MIRRLLLGCTLLSALQISPATILAAQTVAPPAAPTTPPMGWNSWDAYGLTITEAQFRAHAAVLRDKLLPFGWRYAVIDEGWFLRNPQDRPTPEKLIYQLDANGRYVPVPDRFPSSAAKSPETSVDDHSVVDPGNRGFTELARWVHSQGLLFGIHIVRGIPRESVRRKLPIAGSHFDTAQAADTADACPWDPTNWGVRDNAAGQAWYDALLQQYADWGIDLLKVDCIADHPYKVSEIRQIRRAIDKVQAKTGRHIVLSLSPGPTSPSHADEVASLATMWRISNDFWDLWTGAHGPDDFPQSLKGQFDRLATWATLDLPPGTFPDADMLPIGQLRPSPGWGEPRRSRLTPDEQKTVLSLWSLAQSPLILGANLTELDTPTLRLLTNRHVLAIDQHAFVRGRPMRGFETGDLRVWRAELPRSTSNGPNALAVGLFNLSDQPLLVDRSANDLGLVRPGESEARHVLDVWAGKQIPSLPHVRLNIPPHGCVLFLEQ